MAQTIRNRTVRPVRVPLPGGKVLHLGPGHTGQVPDDAIDGASIRDLVEREVIEVVGARAAGVPHEGGDRHEHAVQGHPPNRRAFTTGDR